MSEQNGEIKNWKKRSLMFGAIASLIAIVVGSIALGDKFVTTQSEGIAIHHKIDSTMVQHEFKHKLERIEDKQVLDSMFREIKDINKLLKRIANEN